jgi:hypothetical protein
MLLMCLSFPFPCGTVQAALLVLGRARCESHSCWQFSCAALLALPFAALLAKFLQPNAAGACEHQLASLPSRGACLRRPRPEAVQLDTPPSPVRTPPSPVRTAGAPAGAHGGGRPPLSPMHTPPPSVHTAGPQAPARRGAPGERPPAAMEAGGKAATPLPVSVLPSHALLDLHSSPGSSQPSSPTVEGAHERGANAGIWQ